MDDQHLWESAPGWQALTAEVRLRRYYWPRMQTDQIPLVSPSGAGADAMGTEGAGSACSPRTSWSYWLFGANVRSDLRLPCPPTGARLRPDLIISRLQHPIPPKETAGAGWVTASDDADASGEAAFALHKSSARTIVRIGQVGELEIRPESIGYWPVDDSCLPLLVAYMLSGIMAYWLELRGFLVLHASAVRFGESTIAFVANSGTGKSTLAAALVRAGHQFVTDDLLAVRPTGPRAEVTPGFARMRLSPAEAARCVGNASRLEVVDQDPAKRWVDIGPTGFGSFAAETGPLAAILLLRRAASSSGPVYVRPLSRRAGFVELARHSFAGRLAHIATSVEGRTARLAAMTALAPVCYLDYPSGLEYLPAIREALLHFHGDLP